MESLYEIGKDIQNLKNEVESLRIMVHQLQQELYKDEDKPNSEL